MASRIQGITVEIGGDTTKLSKALESVNKSIKGTQSGLKDVNKLLKLDPSNTELVVQKQKMLKDTGMRILFRIMWKVQLFTVWFIMFLATREPFLASSVPMKSAKKSRSGSLF